MEKFFKNKKILITGNTGFKGSWLTLFLKKYTNNLYGISYKSNNDFFYKRIGLDKHINTKNLNILDKKKLKKYLNEIKPKIIFHLAAEAIVLNSYKKPRETFDINVMGLVNLLEVLREKEFRNITVIIVTTDKCYEPNHKKKFKESDKLGGDDVYSASKACAEIITKAYYCSFFKNKSKNIKIATVRAGNVIGPGDFGKHRLIPDIIRSIKKNQIIKIRNPKHKRPWQHVKDCINGYLLTAEYINYEQIKFSNWNFGLTNNKIDVEYIVNESLTKFRGAKWKITKANYSENSSLELNSNKSLKLLNWKPKYTIKKSISETLMDYEILLNSKYSKSSLLLKFLKDIKTYSEK